MDNFNIQLVDDTIVVKIVEQTFPIVKVGQIGEQGPPGPGTNYTFADDEVPTGIKDGINTVFNIAHVPLVGTFKVYLNGLKLTSGLDYNLVGQVLTMINVPYALDNFSVDYIY